MKINNQTPVNIAILNCQGKVVATASNCRFMSVKALKDYIKGQVDFLKHKAQTQTFAHLRPSKALIMSENQNLTLNF